MKLLNGGRSSELMSCLLNARGRDVISTTTQAWRRTTHEDVFYQIHDIVDIAPTGAVRIGSRGDISEEPTLHVGN